ncbi:MAG: CYTH domain-containing protein [Gammaproteobacteria bacterium]|nr:CYTH domain-containing protein [Gammaproteobacteria bacterium]MBU2056249.1 CYTH domain-containing protein [Gammaproteobacteria bacterium]MBU2174664.1 CYTH domain-containing protein [Gammaproteobacteria bacterium]MBU2248825.1 CYTH domain-containing protein [Gammaproteobacteria bacterium]MBU2345827.1 CYTH domain-containing protein [Gammaproteobacteria bacterium]
MAMEAELKFLLTQSSEPALEPVWQQLAVTVQKHERVQLLNAYYETDELWFRRHDAGLRTRLKKGQFEQTIKLAGQQHGGLHFRPEYNLPCASVWPELNAFPADIWPEGTDLVVLQSQLKQLFRTDFIRQSWLLTLADGSTVEAVLDQGEVVSGEQNEAIFELELELQQGEVKALFELSRQLVQLLPLRLGWQSKAERGYRLAQQQPLVFTALDNSSTAALLKSLQYHESYFLRSQDSESWQVIAQCLRALSVVSADFAALPPPDAKQALSFFSSAAYNCALLNCSESLFSA